MKASNVPYEQVKELRRVIDEQLKSKDVYGQIRMILSNVLHQSNETKSDDYISQALKERDILEQVTGILKAQESITTSFSSVTTKRNVKKKFLHLKILEAKAFLEQPEVDNVRLSLYMLISCF